MGLSSPQRRRLIREAEEELRRLERELASGDEEARRKLLRKALRGEFTGKKLYPPNLRGDKPLGKAPERVRKLASENRRWEILWMVIPNKEIGGSIEEFGIFYGTLEGAMDYADREMVRRFERFGVVYPEGPQGMWQLNPNYGDDEVWSRGYGHDDSASYAVAYVGEPGWGA